jgi:hypothetical protein
VDDEVPTIRDHRTDMAKSRVIELGPGRNQMHDVLNGGLSLGPDKELSVLLTEME